MINESDQARKMRILLILSFALVFIAITMKATSNTKVDNYKGRAIEEMDAVKSIINELILINKDLLEAIDIIQKGYNDSKIENEYQEQIGRIYQDFKTLIR